jgi:hypothetical protein
VSWLISDTLGLFTANNPTSKIVSSAPQLKEITPRFVIRLQVRQAAARFPVLLGRALVT